MPVTQVRKTWVIKHKQHHKIIVRKKLIIIQKSVWGNSLQHLGFLPLLLRQFSSVYFLIISFMSPLRQRGLYRREKNTRTRTDENSDMQRREMPIKYSSTTSGWLWIAYGRDLCLTMKLIVWDVWILKDFKCKISGAACSLFELCTTAGHLVQYLSSGPLAPDTKFST